MDRPVLLFATFLVSTIFYGCVAETDDFHSQSAALTSSGPEGDACGLSISPNPLGLPSSIGQAIGSVYTLTDVLIDHPLISPNGDGIHDDSRIVARAHIPQLPDAHLFEYQLQWTLNIVSTESCDIVTQISDSADVNFQSANLNRQEDWESRPEGTRVTDQFAGFTVSCAANGWINGVDECILLNSELRSTPQVLRTTDGGNVLVIAATKNRRPRAALQGGRITLEFDEPSTLNQLEIKRFTALRNAFVVVHREDQSQIVIPLGSNPVVNIFQEDVVRADIFVRGPFSLNRVDFDTQEGGADVHVETLWDATDGLANLLSNGNYAFSFTTELVRSDDVLIESLESGWIGFSIDATPLDVSDFTVVQVCDPNTDPDSCFCPAGSTTCSSAIYPNLLTFENPALIAPNFITTTYDSERDRYDVTADLRTFNAGGLIPKGTGAFPTEFDLRMYISTLTGVPVSMDERLFNFDYTELGVSTAVTPTGFASTRFNNLLFDLITDESGNITVAGVETSLAEFLNTTMAAPAEYQIINSREDEECTGTGAFNGSTYISAKLCAYAHAVELLEPFGVYTFQSAAFGLTVDGLPSIIREVSCDGICNFRSFQKEGIFTLQNTYYTNAGLVDAYTETLTFAAPAVSRIIDRKSEYGILSGVCGRAFVQANDLTVRMTVADGAVGENCVINGLLE